MAFLRKNRFSACRSDGVARRCLAQSGKVYRVGLVIAGAPDTGMLGPGMVSATSTKRGYVVDKNIVFERRAAQGKVD